MEGRMTRRSIVWRWLGLGLLCLAAGGLPGVGGHVAGAQPTAPPGGDYQKASALMAVPEFAPGLGVLYVQPKNVPVGPYMAYDREGHLVSTVYMIPIKDFQAHRKFDEAVAPGMAVDHVDMVYDAGHPGLPEPHYDVILWYVPKAQAAALK
jgi:hypothetical protein